MDYENSFKPPFTNRGASTPIDTQLRDTLHFAQINDSYLLVDWIQCTIRSNNFNVYSFFRDILHIDVADIICSANAFFGYNISYSYKDIKIFENDIRDDMGFHLYITGQGCRDLEDLGVDYEFLFKKLLEYNSFFTRVDISFDLFTDKYFSVEKIKRCIKNNEVVSKFRNSIEFIKTSLYDSSNKGFTIWFGSRSSKIQIVFYDKLKERESQNFIVSNDISFWNRLEIRFRDNYANEVIYNFINNDFNDYIIGILNNYICFKEYNSNDLSHKYRWVTKDWWSSFIDSASKYKFKSVNYEDNITKKINWLAKSVSRSNFMAFLSDLDFNTSFDSISSNYLFEFLKEGRDRIDEKDLQYINSYRIKNGLNPLDLDSIRDLLRDVKDLLIIKN